MIRKVIQFLVVRILGLYISVRNKYTYENTTVFLNRNVFHPGMFFSTKFFFAFCNELVLENKTVLELGAGTGLISFLCAQKGAIVSASDVNKDSIKVIKKSQVLNDTFFKTYLSDLFVDIPKQIFDVILINPPYYRRTPKKDIDKAFFCGENFEYFIDLFKQLPSYTKPSTNIYMILADNVDFVSIENIALNEKFKLVPVKHYKNSMEVNIIYKCINNIVPSESLIS